MIGSVGVVVVVDGKDAERELFERRMFEETPTTLNRIR